MHVQPYLFLMVAARTRGHHWHKMARSLVFLGVYELKDAHKLAA